MYLCIYVKTRQIILFFFSLWKWIRRSWSNASDMVIICTVNNPREYSQQHDVLNLHENLKNFNIMLMITKIFILWVSQSPFDVLFHRDFKIFCISLSKEWKVSCFEISSPTPRKLLSWYTYFMHVSFSSYRNVYESRLLPSSFWWIFNKQIFKTK